MFDAGNRGALWVVSLLMLRKQPLMSDWVPDLTEVYQLYRLCPYKQLNIVIIVVEVLISPLSQGYSIRLT